MGRGGQPLNRCEPVVEAGGSRLVHERGDAVGLGARTGFHVSGDGLGKQRILHPVEDRGPEALLLDSLEALVGLVSRGATEAATEVQLNLRIRKCHVIDTEAPVNLPVLNDLGVLPSEGFVRLIVLEGRGFIEHDGVLDLRSALSGFGGTTTGHEAPK